MQYFVDYITSYSSVNKKGLELQEFVGRFFRRLIPDQLSYDAMKAEIEHEIERLNKAYPRSKTLILSEYRGVGFHQLQAHVKDNTDKVVFILSIMEVFGTYRYCEQIPDTENHNLIISNNEQE